MGGHLRAQSLHVSYAKIAIEATMPSHSTNVGMAAQRQPLRTGVRQNLLSPDFPVNACRADRLYSTALLGGDADPAAL